MFIDDVPFDPELTLIAFDLACPFISGGGHFVNHIQS
jgi:hypothetical protein